MTKQELLDFIDTTGVVRVKDLALKFHLWDPEARAHLHALASSKTYARSVIVVDHTGPSPAITPERGN